MNHRSVTSSRRARLLALGSVVGFSVLLGCNAILGIQKAERSGNDCELDFDEDIIEGCIFRASCDPSSPPFSLSFCVTYTGQAASPEEKGTLKASNCATIEENIGHRYEPRDSCPDDATGWLCSADGSVAQYCGKGRPFSWNCGLRDSVCTVEANSPASAYPCGIPDHISCETNPPEKTFCEGSLQLGCSGSRPIGFDCAAVDTDCFETERGATCLPDGGNCTAFNEVTCKDDSSLDFCAEPGVVAHYKCAQGTTCRDGDAGVGCYLETCEPADGCKEGCTADGTSVEFCVAGAKVTRKCADYGFDHCASYEAEDVPYAYCTMAEGKPFPGTSADWGEQPGDGSGGSNSGGGSGGSAAGTGGQSGNDDCYALAPGSCTSLEACSDAEETDCYYLVDGKTRINEDCAYPGEGYEQVAALCELAPPSEE